MIQACRTALLQRSRSRAGRAPAHPGLLLARYLQQTDDDSASKREDLLPQAVKALGQAGPVYRAAYARWCELLPRLPGPTVSRPFEVAGRLVIGLGTASVLECGLTLHHTYGVPLLPGSGLKGLAAHYCAATWSTADAEFGLHVPDPTEEEPNRTRPGHHYQALFGATDEAGHIIFHDAWLLPEGLSGALAEDVMTPHHGDYYGAADGNQEDAPTDFDDPNPVSYLSVRGQFLVALSCDVGGESGERWLALAMELLTQALGEWGVGGKTSSGYGRLVPVPAAAPAPAQDAKPAGKGGKGTHGK